MTEDGPSTLVVAVAVVALILVASFGFRALSWNPIAPEAELAVTDGPDEFVLDESGNVSVFEVHHRGGDPVDVGGIEIVLGSRLSGVTFNASNDWTVGRRVVFRVFLDGRPLNLTDDRTFDSGETLALRRTRGTTTGEDSYRVTVRVYHVPSQRTIVKQVVTID